MRKFTALIAALAVAIAAHAKDQGEPMKDAQTTQTLCLGRFLVDVPKSAIIVANPSDYRSRGISSETMSAKAFDKMLLDKESQLKTIRHEKEASLLRQLVKAGNGETATFVFRESPIDAYQYKVQGYKWLNRLAYTLDSRVDDDRVNRALELSAKTLAELQFRRNEKIPDVPGFCFKNGFFPGEPPWPHNEKAFVHLRFKSNPDVMVTIQITMNGDKLNEGLLARIDREPVPDIYKEVAKKIRTLRRGSHPVGSLQAEDILETLPHDRGYSNHMFTWEVTGKPRDLYHPSIAVNMESGETFEGKAVRPSLTDQQAIELFDNIVNSIRLRPTGGSVAPEQPKPAPRPQAKAPLGTQLITGSRCPQSGTWICEHHEALGGNRRYFAEGETLTSVMVPAKRDIWQQLKGDAKNRPQETIWTLAEISAPKAGS